MSYASLDTQGSAREENMTLEELQKQLEVANKAVEAANSRADQAEKAFKAEKLRADNADVARAEAERAKVASEVTATNAQAALALEKTRADNAEQALKTEKTRADQAEAQASEKARADSAATINARVNERVKLFDAANRVLGSTDEKGTAIDRSAMSDRDIKSKIIEHVDGIDVTKHPSAQGAHGDVFIDGVFEGALARHTASAESRAAVRATIQAGRSDTGAPGSAKPRKDADDSEEAAANNMRRDTSTTWGKSHRRV